MGAMKELAIELEETTGSLIDTACRYRDMADELRDAGQIAQAETFEAYASIMEEEACNA